jgi:hypothetical protein
MTDPQFVKKDTTKRALAFWVVPKSGSIGIQWGSIVRFLNHVNLGESVQTTWLPTSQQRLQRQKDRLYTVNSRPLVLMPDLAQTPRHRDHTCLQNVQTDSTTLDVYIRVVTWRVKFNGGSGVGIVARE